MTPTEHAEHLAQKLEAVLALNLFAEGGEHLLEVAEARSALNAWDSRDPLPIWAPVAEAASRLGVSDKTLKRWRDAQKITPGVHWRRMNAGSRCIYNVPLLAERMEALAILEAAREPK